MIPRSKITARDYRIKVLKCIWAGSRQLGLSDPRSFAPPRDGITGKPGATLSKCTLGELIEIAHKIKMAGASIWVPVIPRGALLCSATPWQLARIQNFLSRQNYLKDPDQFFIKRLKVKNPQHPTFQEAARMLGFLGSKERTTKCA